MQYLFYAGAVLLLMFTLAGLILMGVGVGKMLSDLVLELRSRRLDPEPADEQLLERAAAAVEQVSRRAGVAAPAVLVVPLLGRPFPGQQRRSVGTGGLAVTRFTPGQPVSIVFARAALTELSRRALDHLVAHELGHVIRYRTRIGRVRHYAWSIGFLAVTLPMAAWVVATQSGALLAATATVALGYLVLRAVWQRREEGEADLFAIALTADLDGCAELMTFYEQNMRDEPLPDGRLRRGLTIIDRRWLATHPEPHQRLQVMSDHWHGKPDARLSTSVRDVERARLPGEDQHAIALQPPHDHPSQPLRPAEMLPELGPRRTGTGLRSDARDVDASNLSVVLRQLLGLFGVGQMLRAALFPRILECLHSRRLGSRCAGDHAQRRPVTRETSFAGGHDQRRVLLIHLVGQFAVAAGGLEEGADLGACGAPARARVPSHAAFEGSGPGRHASP